jgi:hypothetical protein
VGSSYAFTATVTPSSATVPLNYTVLATDAEEQTLNNSESKSIVATYT